MNHRGPTSGAKPRFVRNLLIASLTLVVGGCGLLAGAGDGNPEPDPRAPQISELRRVVPSSGLPDELYLQASNNNLDVVRHNGRLFLAFRTAPTHFASPLAALYVVSSADEKHWRMEGMFVEWTDVREPRLLSYRGKLLLYYARLGTEMTAFEPLDAQVAIYHGPKNWSKPRPFYRRGFIPWRTKVIGGVAYMVGYVGGGSIVDGSRGGQAVHWLRSDDGLAWRAAVAGRPVVHRGGSSEADFVLLKDGSLVAVMRNEGGDNDGWGSKICRAAADDLANWQCRHDPRKYDSPLLFVHRDRVLLIGRRNVTATGEFDLKRRTLPDRLAIFLNHMSYSTRRKRCAVWEVDANRRSVNWLTDLPSRGDTCFASLSPLDDDHYAVYNYSSPLEGGQDPVWLAAQLGPTSIYRHTLNLTARLRLASVANKTH